MDEPTQGTVVASPLVGAGIPTHFSTSGAGGHQEVPSIFRRNQIPISDPPQLHYDGYGSGRRRLGMKVVVTDQPLAKDWITYGLDIDGYEDMSPAQRLEALADNNNWRPVAVGAGGETPAGTPVNFIRYENDPEGGQMYVEPGKFYYNGSGIFKRIGPAVGVSLIDPYDGNWEPVVQVPTEQPEQPQGAVKSTAVFLTAPELLALIRGKKLEPGAFYSWNYYCAQPGVTSQARYNGQPYNAGQDLPALLATLQPERLTFQALTTGQLAPTGYSSLYPQDEISVNMDYQVGTDLEYFYYDEDPGLTRYIEDVATGRTTVPATFAENVYGSPGSLEAFLADPTGYFVLAYDRSSTYYLPIVSADPATGSFVFEGLFSQNPSWEGYFDLAKIVPADLPGFGLITRRKTGSLETNYDYRKMVFMRHMLLVDGQEVGYFAHTQGFQGGNGITSDPSKVGFSVTFPQGAPRLNNVKIDIAGLGGYEAPHGVVIGSHNAVGGEISNVELLNVRNITIYWMESGISFGKTRLENSRVECYARQLFNFAVSGSTDDLYIDRGMIVGNVRAEYVQVLNIKAHIHRLDSYYGFDRSTNIVGGAGVYHRTIRFEDNVEFATIGPDLVDNLRVAGASTFQTYSGLSNARL